MQEQNSSQDLKLPYDRDWESKLIATCEQRGYFEVEGNKHLQASRASLPKSEKNFCIIMPPPNVTGILHIGHSLTFTLQDIITRYKRMDGYKMLWQPGLDHAGIATQNVVEKQLLAQGIKKEDIGREAFIKKVWEWKEESGGKILSQMRTLGFSPAFKRTRFTMDPGLANAVKKTFVSWFDKGLIYQGNRMINWCTHDGALSDIEVDYVESDSKLYYMRYFFKDSKDYLVVATTRPETFFGDTAVMVNPNDERYKSFIGKSVVLPLSGKEIKVIADESVDSSFGTGCVKVTPAHDLNDYEVGLKHNLEFVVIFDEKGILNEYALNFKGLERLEAREKIVEELEKQGYIEKIEDYKNSVAKCYRCGNTIEPYISKQWFVKAKAAKPAIKLVAEKQTTFFPPNWENNYNAWMRDLRDWCISRQLWWGHRIPIFYCESCNHVFASEEVPSECPKCKSTKLHQDPDVLDTWFSSALFDHSTLGWGNKDFGKGTLWQVDDLENFHPNSLLITGFDILFFWVARMLLASAQNLGEIAFRHIYLHALVLDEKGFKMSKSKGNVIDPLDIAKTYSADILRFSLSYMCAQGRDVRMSFKQLEVTRNFTNKLINAKNFLELYASQLDPNYSFNPELKEYKTSVGKYMKSRFNLCVKELREALETYRFDSASSVMYRFLWSEFCDVGIELAKVEKESVFELASIFLDSMKLLNPFMPFISEYIYQSLLKNDINSFEWESIMVKSFPKIEEQDKDIEVKFEVLLDALTTLRRLKANSKASKAYIKLNKQEKDFEFFKPFLTKLAKLDLELVDSKKQDSVGDVGVHCECFVVLEKEDLEKLKLSLETKKAKLEKEVAKLESMLKNPSFIQNAKSEVVENTKLSLESNIDLLKKVVLELQGLR
ncbi:valine--tRNA ligase [Helicobacter sp. 13S00401-1]|uniref:valine--tRNA ligase n=1 Tax=Helicobacter sp. 13S00401-1 TaxID=1905758 RepID=UPI000BA5DEB5|nr:valine--tRNA ligase [Helicobacter sp. 13S00401-1]PAF50888.1 valine--tRNA ligase [Helicobacter sp. 13S00401-1]